MHRYDLITIDFAIKDFYKKPIKTFMEIGSRDGLDANHMFNAYGLYQNDVYIFEPHPICFQNIKNNFGMFNVYDYVVSNHNEKCNFHAGSVNEKNNYGMSSVHELLNNENFEESVVERNCIRMDKFLNSVELENIDVLKIDVEGHTYEVLEGFGERLQDVNIIQFETEYEQIFKDQKTHDSVQKLLIDNGFVELFSVRLCKEQGDCVYIKNK